MMPFRALAHSVPRAVPRLFATTARRSVGFQARTFLEAPRVHRQATACFSSSVLRRAPSGEADEELVAKLDSELQFENSVRENEPQPASIADFIENGPFKVEDVPGQEEIKLTRAYGNENISITFSIADLLNNAENPAYDDDAALSDEELEDSRNIEENRAAEDAEEAGEGEALPSPPIRLNIVVEKQGRAGALNVEATAHEGNIAVENVFYYDDAAMAHSTSAEVDHKARDAYPGPPFETLDEDLQILMDRYLEERGVNEALAVFIPDYVDAKEQREYLSWLGKVKSFVAA